MQKHNILMRIIVCLLLLIACFSMFPMRVQAVTITPTQIDSIKNANKQVGCGGKYGPITYKEFLEKYLMPAYKCYLFSGMSPGLTLAQLGQEGGYGCSSLSVQENNFWGMKCTGGGDAGHGVTHEKSSKKYTDAKGYIDYYRKHSSPTQAFLDRPYFFWKSTYYPHIKEKLKNGTANTWESMLDESTQPDWEKYCPGSPYRSTLRKMCKQELTYFYKYDDEAFLVGTLIALGQYKMGDPIMICGKAYYPGDRNTYNGQMVTLDEKMIGEDGTKISEGSAGTSGTAGVLGSTEPTPTPEPQLLKERQLEYSEWLVLENIRGILQDDRDGKLVSWIRVPGIIFGVLLILYGLLLVMAYYIDVFNPFTSFSVTEKLTFGKCNALSPEMYKSEGKWTEDGKRNLSLVTIISRAATCIVIGALFIDINTVLGWFLQLYLWIGDLINNKL